MKWCSSCESYTNLISLSLLFSLELWHFSKFANKYLVTCQNIWHSSFLEWTWRSLQARHQNKAHTHCQLFFLRIYVYVSLGDRRNKINNTREPLDQLKNPHPPEARFFAINESDRFFLQWFNVFWNRFTNHKAQKQVIWTMSWWQEQMVITFLRAGLWLGSSKTGKDQI